MLQSKVSQAESICGERYVLVVGVSSGIPAAAAQSYSIYFSGSILGYGLRDGVCWRLQGRAENVALGYISLTTLLLFMLLSGSIFQKWSCVNTLFGLSF